MQAVADTYRYIEQRHNYWVAHLTDWFERNQFYKCFAQGVPTPSFRIALKTPKHAGYCKWVSRQCTYSLAYAMLNIKAYDDTIAHECCHAFQKFIGGKKTHGELFLFLLGDVCGKPKYIYHHYSRLRAENVNKILRSQLKVAYITPDYVDAIEHLSNIEV